MLKTLISVVIIHITKWEAVEVIQSTKANMQNSEECSEFEANENSFWKTVQQRAKNAISYNMSSATTATLWGRNLFKGPGSIAIDSVGISSSQLHTHTKLEHPHPPLSPPPRKLLAAPSTPWSPVHSQLCYWVSSHNGLRRAIEIRCCTYTKVWRDTL